jgi:hypothetical protein
MRNQKGRLAKKERVLVKINVTPIKADKKSAKDVLPGWGELLNLFYQRFS